jgi:AraC family transcriptional regulator
MSMNTSASLAVLPQSPVPPFLASLIQRAAAALAIDVATSRECLQRAVALLGVQIAEAKGSRTPLAAWQTKKLLSYIEGNLSNNISAQDLSDLVNLSASHLSRAFKASVGVPPRRFIISSRIRRSQVLLRTSQLSLAEIALDCGFCDQSSLCRHFRRLVGQTPYRWRRENASIGDVGQALAIA